MVYIDDVLVMGSSFQSHINILRLVLERIQASGTKLEHSKCKLSASELVYLGHLASATGIRPNPNRVSTLIRKHASSFLKK